MRYVTRSFVAGLAFGLMLVVGNAAHAAEWVEPKDGVFSEK
ncbi:MAG: hypothetical protein JWO87_3021, partial [Phycisphaerales bacterium]|nr:hypothetical protein [Phycisphaerales bacterium]